MSEVAPFVRLFRSFWEQRGDKNVCSATDNCVAATARNAGVENNGPDSGISRGVEHPVTVINHSASVGGRLGKFH
jgi:hypothetical protein